MYFVLEKGQQKFEYMKYGVGVVLAYVGVKMLLMDIVTINLIVSLVIIASILGISVLLSYIVKPKGSVSL